MRQRFGGSLVVIWLFATLATSCPAQTNDDRLDELVRNETPWLIRTYERLHESPELPYGEKSTSQFVAKTLSDLGFEVTAPFGIYADAAKTSYGVVGILRNGIGPTVLIRGEMDALPIQEETGLPYASQVSGVMHSCGHDMNVASMLGVARVLTKIKDQWHGTLMLIGQPSEEVDVGSKSLLDAGLYKQFPKPDYALASHAGPGTAGTIHYKKGYVLANIDSIDITVRGIGGHGAAPQTTKDPIVIASEIVVMLQTIVSREVSPTDPAVITVGAIRGGTQRNIIPEEVHLELTVRSLKPEVRAMLLSSIKKVAEGVARAEGVPDGRLPIVQVLEGAFVPSLYNDPALTERLGSLFRQSFGAKSIVEHDQPGMGGDDFANYAAGGTVPSFMFYLGVADPDWPKLGITGGGAHSSHFRIAPEVTLQTDLKAMSLAVLELLKK
jgi:hippurate hydrolase